MATLAELRDRVRRLADIERALDRFPDAEVNGYVNDGLRRWHRTLVTVWADWFLTSALVNPIVTSSIGSGPTLTATVLVLPTDFHSLDRLQVQIGAEGYTRCVPVSRDDMEAWGITTFGSQRRGYMLVEGLINLFPNDSDISTTYLMWYHRKFVPLVGDLDEVSPDVDDWLQLAVLDAAIAIKRKDEEETADLIGEREALTAEVRAAASARDAAATKHTTNVQDDCDGPWWRRLPPP